MNTNLRARARRGIAITFAFATGSAAAATLSAASLDAGGQRSVASIVAIDASLGGIGGVADAGPDVVKGGYVGQLYEVADLVVAATPGTVAEGGTVQLSSLARLDDGTVLPLVASDTVWSAGAFPIAAIRIDGLVTTAIIYADTTAYATGAYLGVRGTVTFLVVDANHDNFDSYAGDGLKDGWQVQYFGTGNANAAPTVDLDGDGFDNLGEYAADTVPTNAFSFHHIVAESNQPAQRIVFFPSSSFRAYSLEATTNLLTGPWQSVAGQTNIAGTGAIMPLADAGGLPVRHYRVRVLVP